MGLNQQAAMLARTMTHPIVVPMETMVLQLNGREVYLGLLLEVYLPLMQVVAALSLVAAPPFAAAQYLLLQPLVAAVGIVAAAGKRVAAVVLAAASG